MTLAPTEAEWLEWTASDTARECRDCGARWHADDGVVADPTVAGTWLCGECAGGYLPCSTCDRAIDRGDACADAKTPLCADCAADAASETDHSRATTAWLDRGR